MLPEYNDRNRALEKIDEPLTQEFLDLSKIVKINTIASFKRKFNMNIIECCSDYLIKYLFSLIL